MTVDACRQRHITFLDSSDGIQQIYERARRAVFDRRIRPLATVRRTLQAHGIAGLFIDIERTLVSFSPRSKPAPTADTAFYQTHLQEAQFESIARALTEGVGVRASARIMAVDKKTVLRVLARAADHATRLSRFLLKNTTVSECQLDEMWSFIGKKEKHLDPIEKLEGILGDAWIWIAFDPVHKLVLAHVIGKRTEPHAVALLEKVRGITADMPSLFTSDQLDQYTGALLKVYGKTVLPPRRTGPGRPPNPKLVPPEGLLYAQVVKQYKRNRLIGITRKVIFGDSEKLKAILEDSIASNTINTSFVERNNGTVRHMDARCSRKTYRFSKNSKNHKRQLELSVAYYNLCLPHKTLTKRYGSPTSPFMSAGLTDHIWTMGELLRTQPKIPCT
ncbi:conserved domain protein [delta proteobacterium NaphS2]|nr:conserved domain protein [delta proteobacterium NaphS2]